MRYGSRCAETDSIAQGIEAGENLSQCMIGASDLNGNLVELCPTCRSKS